MAALGQNNRVIGYGTHRQGSHILPVQRMTGAEMGTLKFKVGSYFKSGFRVLVFLRDF